MAEKILDLENLLRIPWVDTENGFDISPDGGRICFSWNHSGQWELYELLIDGSTPPKQITRHPGAKFAPRYSPDGNSLAYVIDLDGGENYDVMLYDIANQVHINLTPDTPEAIQPNLSWSPDSKHLALISNRQGEFDVYLLSIEGHTLQRLTDLSKPAFTVEWSPNGRWLAVTVEAKGQEFNTYLVSLEGDKLRSIDVSGHPANARDACWSPDSKQVVFSGDFEGEYNLGVYSLETGHIVWLTNDVGEKLMPDWSSDGRHIVYIHSHREQTWLGMIELPSKTGVSGNNEHSCLTPIRYQVEPGVHHHPRFTPDGSVAICVFDNPRHPDDLWLLSLKDGQFRQLTDSLPTGRMPADFYMPEAVQYPTTDGVMVPALLFRPDREEMPAPAVILIHGGPSWAFQFLWYPIMQHMTSRGWVVLAPNYRGSTGYGKEWQLANRYDLGGVDRQDVTAGIDYLITNGLANPARVAVSGRSHGGFLTMSCMTQNPDRWAAGSAVVPFLNWFTSHANSRGDLQHWDRENMGDPVTNYDLWYERSPYFFLDRIQAPVQLICGENDPRCPASESLAARDKLQSLGKTVDFALYTDEGHAFLKIENVIDAEQRRIAFLARYLDPS